MLVVQRCPLFVFDRVRLPPSRGPRRVRAGATAKALALRADARVDVGPREAPGSAAGHEALKRAERGVRVLALAARESARRPPTLAARGDEAMEQMINDASNQDGRVEFAELEAVGNEDDGWNRPEGFRHEQIASASISSPQRKRKAVAPRRGSSGSSFLNERRGRR